MSAVCIITARGGSKRIPGKNIRPFLGKPILAYSIEAARKSGLFDRVMVSTDSGKIAEVARAYGAEVPFLRSEKTAGDFATTADVVAEVLDSYRAQGLTFDILACLYPTAPFVTAGILQEAAKKLEESNTIGSADGAAIGAADGVVPVVRFSFPPQRGFVVREGLLAYEYPEFRSARSQDLEPLYHDAGQFYLCRVDAFLRERTVVPEKCVPLILPETRVQDIDNEADWEIAEIKYQRLVKSMEETQ